MEDLINTDVDAEQDQEKQKKRDKSKLTKSDKQGKKRAMILMWRP